MTSEERITQLENEVAELKRMLSVKELTEANIPRTIDFPITGAGTADGRIPMLIDGVRYNVVVENV